MPGRNSGGHGDARDDADRSGAGAKKTCAAVPTGELRNKSGEYGALHRAYRPGASQALQDAAWTGILVQIKVRDHSMLHLVMLAMRQAGKLDGARHIHR